MHVSRFLPKRLVRVGRRAIASVGGTPTSTTGALSAILAELKPGRKVSVVIRHQNGAKSTVQVTLGTYPGS